MGTAPFIPFFENFGLYAEVMIGTATLLFPVIFRLSRHGWLKMLNKYNKDAIAKHNQSYGNVVSH